MKNISKPALFICTCLVTICIVASCQIYPDIASNRYFIAGAVIVVASLISSIVADTFEQRLFAIFILTLPVRAVARLAEIPIDIALLSDSWTSTERGWTGASPGTPSLTISDIPLILLIAYAFAKRQSRESFPWWVLIGGFLLTIAGLMSLLNARQLALGVWTIADLIKAILGCVYVVYRTRTKNDFRFVLKVTWISLAIEAIIAIVQGIVGSSLGLAFSGIDWVEREPAYGVARVTGTFAHPQMFAMYLSCFLPLLVCAMVNRPVSRRRSLIGKFLILLIVCALILTFSRMAWLAFVCVIIFMYMTFLVLRMRGLSRLYILAGLIGVICLALLFPAIATNLVSDREESRAEITRDLYQVAFAMFKAEPMIGVGINNFSYVMNSYDSSGISSYYPVPVHNMYILLLAETGILGLGAFIIVLAIPLRIAIRAMRGGDPEIRGYGVGLIGGLLSLGMLSLTGWTYYAIQAQVWYFLGVILSIERLRGASNFALPRFSYMPVSYYKEGS